MRDPARSRLMLCFGPRTRRRCADGVELQIVDCLDECDRSNVSVMRRSDVRSRQRATWLGTWRPNVPPGPLPGESGTAPTDRSRTPSPGRWRMALHLGRGPIRARRLRSRHRTGPRSSTVTPTSPRRLTEREETQRRPIGVAVPPHHRSSRLPPAPPPTQGCCSGPTVQQVPSDMSVTAPPAKVLRRDMSQSWKGICASVRKCPAKRAWTTVRRGAVRHLSRRRPGLLQNE